jgi:hypothetical protein
LVVSGILTRSEAVAVLECHPKQTPDHQFLSFTKVTFGGQFASVSLCFYKETLEYVALNAIPPGWERHHNPPEIGEIEAEIAFIRMELRRQLGHSFQSGHVAFEWGDIWVGEDCKTGFPSTALRYKVPKQSLRERLQNHLLRKT